MTDYTELLELLRYCSSKSGCIGCKLSEAYDCTADLTRDAAAAIEALQAEVERLKAENPIVETVLVDKMRQQMEETVCHCQVKENAELIAKILDDDVDGKAYEPKRGEIVRCMDCKHRPTGTGVNHDIEFPDAICPCQCYDDYWYSWMPSDDWYCADGEKMEVQ